MKRFKKIMAGVLLVAIMSMGIFFVACDGCGKKEEPAPKTDNETENDLSDMWDDEFVGDADTDPTGKNGSDYTGWVK